MRYLSLAGIWTPRGYDSIARYYDLFFKCFFRTAEKARCRVVEDLNSGSILDVACGTGVLLAMAHEKGLRCYGVDTSQGMLNRAKSRVPGAKFAKASFYDIPYPDGYFDYVVSTNAIGAVGVDAKKVLSEMLRVCKDGGEIQIADYSKPPTVSWKSRILTKFVIFIGDFPQDYLGIFRELGYEPKVEVLGEHGMYQLTRIKKAH